MKLKNLNFKETIIALTKAIIRIKVILVENQSKWKFKITMKKLEIKTIFHSNYTKVLESSHSFIPKLQ
jgi:hypothetical protein